MPETNSFQDQLKNLKKRKEILVILLFFFVIVIFWIGLSLFSSQQQAGITAEQKKLAQPLPPNINTAVIEKIEEKRAFSDFELKDFPIYSMYDSGTGIEVVDITKDLPKDVLANIQSPEASSEATPETGNVQIIDNYILQTEE